MTLWKKYFVCYAQDYSAHAWKPRDNPGEHRTQSPGTAAASHLHILGTQGALTLPTLSSDRLMICSSWSPKQPLRPIRLALQEFVKVPASSAPFFGGKSNVTSALRGEGGAGIACTAVSLPSAPGPHHGSSRTGSWPLDSRGTCS